MLQADPPSTFVPDSPLCAVVAPSPNYGERRNGRPADLLLLHYTGMSDGASAIAWLRDPASGVSCHYVVEEDGCILQLVPEAARAWHAGASCWAGERDVNSRSIGIEIVNPGHDNGLPDYPDRQIEALIALCRDIAARRCIRPERVLAHSDVAPARKRDPGERFPWDRLHAAGVGHWTPPAPRVEGPALGPGSRGEPVRRMQAALAAYGYGLDATAAFDRATEDVVRAFQRHFRPECVDGVADASTLATLRDLHAALASGHG